MAAAIRNCFPVAHDVPRKMAIFGIRTRWSFETAVTVGIGKFLEEFC
jgi:hypothetical protein